MTRKKPTNKEPDAAEREYWDRYHALLAEHDADDITCQCHGTRPKVCPAWQELRLTIQPSPNESRYLDSRNPRGAVS